jgi:hypothetical protein
MADGWGDGTTQNLSAGAQRGSGDKKSSVTESRGSGKVEELENFESRFAIP